MSNLIIAYLLEEQNTLCTPPAGGKDQSGGKFQFDKLRIGQQFQFFDDLFRG
ncbi:hypothetical protein [Faecalibacterium prausnitzii]|uniref:hypothetical protein n=1 Tax=Faecalibacterium prausnitzii TaxID=853 RepID=UPI0015DDEF74|nr:hypothetical protein [Faecalibacterium prausnitzii]